MLYTGSVNTRLLATNIVMLMFPSVSFTGPCSPVAAGAPPALAQWASAVHGRALSLWRTVAATEPVLRQGQTSYDKNTIHVGSGYPQLPTQHCVSFSDFALIKDGCFV